MISGVFGTSTSIGPFIPTVFGQKSFSFEVDTNDVFYTITLGTMVASLVLGCLTGIIGINNRNKYFESANVRTHNKYMKIERKINRT